MELPIYKIKGKLYFLDKRLNEYRNIKNPFDVLNFDSVSLKDLQTPNNLQEIKEKGLSNNKETREKLNYPTAEEIVRELK